MHLREALLEEIGKLAAPDDPAVLNALVTFLSQSALLLKRQGGLFNAASSEDLEPAGSERNLPPAGPPGTFCGLWRGVRPAPPGSGISRFGNV